MYISHDDFTTRLESLGQLFLTGILKASNLVMHHLRKSFLYLFICLIACLCIDWKKSIVGTQPTMQNCNSSVPSSLNQNPYDTWIGVVLKFIRINTLYFKSVLTIRFLSLNFTVSVHTNTLFMLFLWHQKKKKNIYLVAIVVIVIRHNFKNKMALFSSDT